MNPYRKITMHDLPVAAKITIKLIDAIDAKFDRFRK